MANESRCAYDQKKDRRRLHLFRCQSLAPRLLLKRSMSLRTYATHRLLQSHDGRREPSAYGCRRSCRLSSVGREHHPANRNSCRPSPVNRPIRYDISDRDPAAGRPLDPVVHRRDATRQRNLHHADSADLGDAWRIRLGDHGHWSL